MALLAMGLIASALPAPRLHAATGPDITLDPIIFTNVPMSTPPLANPAGIWLTPARVVASTFRITQPTHVTALGGYFDSHGDSVYLGLYKLDTSGSKFDAVHESDLLATTLAAPASGGGNASGAVSVTLQPGWYAVGMGVGRNGATAADADIPSFSTNTQNYQGTYALSTSDNGLTKFAVQARVFVRGVAVSAPPATSDYLRQTAKPTALWSNTSSNVDATHHFGTRFHVDATVHVTHVSAWLMYGSGSVFAAIVRLPSSNSSPQPYGTTAFANSLVGTTLIPVGSPRSDYGGPFDNLELTPGDYALLIGSGMFGATGDANLMGVSDEVVHPGALVKSTSGSSWYFLPARNYHITLRSDVPGISISPAPVIFPVTAIGNQAGSSLTVTNHGANPVQLGGGTITGEAISAFAVDDPGACLTSLLAASGQCSFSMSYQPATAATHHAALRVTSNGQPDPLVVELRGDSIGLAVQVDNSTHFVAYGESLHYLVTVTNNGTTAVSNVEVDVDLPAQLDAANAIWSCAQPASGCSASGSGNIHDSGIQLAPAASVSYDIDVPVKVDAAGTDVALTASAHNAAIGPFDGSDRDTLVLFRNGFE